MADDPNVDTKGNDPNVGGESKPADTPAPGLTQDAVDKIVADRLKRQETTLRKQWSDEQAAEKAKADMTEAEKYKAALEAANGKTAEVQTAANQRIIKADAKVAAMAAGVKPDRVAALLKLADLKDVTVGEDGEPDASAVEKAITAALTEFPEFKTGPGESKVGTDFKGGAGGKPPITAELIANMKPDELKARMPEIEAFYANQRKT